ncbi:MAG: hypothetical protein LBH35_06200, partial [Treponema sp.]|nr:hypothetical protein [Treponema sp.]
MPAILLIIMLNLLVGERMKKAIFFLFLFQLNYGLYCIEFVVLKRTPLYRYGGPDIIRFLEAGEDVLSNINNVELAAQTGEIKIRCSTNQGDAGWVNADDIAPLDSDSIPDQIRGRKWVYSFYLDILKTGKKETLYNYEPFWKDEWGNGPEGSDQFPLVDWEDEYEPTLFFIKNSVMLMYYLYYFDNIFFLYSNVYTSNTGEVTIKALCYSKSLSYPQNYLNQLFEVSNGYTIVLKHDGDYLDFFVNDKHTCTLMAVDNVFIETIQKIIKGEDYNISEITWP